MRSHNETEETASKCVLMVSYEGNNYFLQRKNVFTSDLKYARIYSSSKVAERAKKRLFGQVFLSRGNTLRPPFGGDVGVVSNSQVVILPASDFGVLA